jgi:hypothetical protein
VREGQTYFGCRVDRIGSEEWNDCHAPDHG